MNKTFAVLLAAPLMGVAASFPNASADWTEPRAYTNEAGKVLLYRWAAPKTVAPDRKYPLVILFHGAGERGSDNAKQLVWGAEPVLRYMRENNIEGYFIAGQVPAGQQWVNVPWGELTHRMPNDASESMGLALDLLVKTMKGYPVDPTRVYATGISMGGYGTWDAITRRPDLFAAAMPCCGGGDVELAWRIRDIPIWAWHGDQDGAVPVTRSRDMTTALWKLWGKIIYTEVPGCGHDVWKPAYASQEALGWLFAQRKGSPMVPPEKPKTTAPATPAAASAAVPAARPICTPEEVAEGFVPLYNGKDLTGWTLQGSEGCYRPGRDGELLFDHTVGNGGTLWTDRDYSDFTLRFEFLLSSDCNNGLAVRTPFGGHAAYDGFEVQMLDDEGAMYTTTFPQLGLYQKAVCNHGSVYGVIASKHKPDGKSYLKMAGEWNSQEVTVIGSKIKVILNGETIVDDDLSRYPTDGTTADGQKHPGLRNKTGRLGWLSHGYPCRWRNIRIKEVK